jgi:hypothetical protein
MNRLRLVFTGFLLLAAVPLARGGVIVTPNADDGTEGNNSTVIPFSNVAWTFQWAVAASQLGSVPAGSQLTAIGFRLDGGQPPGPSSSFTIANWNLQLSRSLRAPGSLSATYASNIGADVVLVRSGPLTLAPNSFPGGASPNPFVDVTFTTPYTYTGGDLLVTLRQSGGGPLLQLDSISLPNALIDSVGSFGDNAAASGVAHLFSVPVNDFQFTMATAIPEPAGLTLVASGALVALRYLRRRRKAARPAC